MDRFGLIQTCRKCQGKLVKNGRSHNIQRYVCSNCGKYSSEGKRKRGGQCKGDRPMTGYERLKNSRNRRMKAKELASILNGREIGEEITAEEIEGVIENNLIVAFGYSDDTLVVHGVKERVDSLSIVRVNGKFFDKSELQEDKSILAKYGFNIEPDIAIDAIDDPEDFDGYWRINVSGVESFPFTIYEGKYPFCLGAVIQIE